MCWELTLVEAKLTWSNARERKGDVGNDGSVGYCPSEGLESLDGSVCRQRANDASCDVLTCVWGPSVREVPVQTGQEETGDTGDTSVFAQKIASTRSD